MDFISKIFEKEDKNTWNPFVRKFYRIVIQIDDFGFDRTFQAVGSEIEPGLVATIGAMSASQALSLAKHKQDRVYEITATIRRLK